MFGAFIGDIVGSKYEFHNIKTKAFPLFSQGCDYTDDTIMTVAVAKAIMLSRTEQFEKNGEGRGFQEFLVEIMQDFGRRYPNPTGAYGGSFAKWLQQQDPKPYGSYGNGSAMRVSPCGLVAVTMDEALALARASSSLNAEIVICLSMALLYHTWRYPALFSVRDCHKNPRMLLYRTFYSITSGIVVKN